MSKQQHPPVYPDEPQIPILPNMLTAGNLLCGFFAILTIYQGMYVHAANNAAAAAIESYRTATYLIFAACAFDLLDGRVARMCKADGPFGREFDSIADVVSFGIAPSLLLVSGVLHELGTIGWGIAVLYMLCASLRLARFNCMAAAPKKPNQSMDFVGLPVPMAAGAVVSTFYLVSYFAGQGTDIPTAWQYVMAAGMAVVSVLMMSRVIYPSFKHVNFEKKGTAMAILLAAIAVLLFIHNPEVAPAIVFLCYLLYGLVVRPFLTRRMRRILEVKDDDDDDEASAQE